MIDAGIEVCRLFGSTVLALTAPGKVRSARDRDIAIQGDANDLGRVALRLSERSYKTAPALRRFEMHRRGSCLILAASAPDGMMWDICALSKVESIGLFDLESAQLLLPAAQLHGAHRAVGALQRGRARPRIRFLTAHPALLVQRLLRLAVRHHLYAGSLAAMHIPRNQRSPPVARASLLVTVIDLLMEVGPSDRALRSHACRRILMAVDPLLCRAMTHALRHRAGQICTARSRRQVIAVLTSALDPSRRQFFARDCVALLRLRDRSAHDIPLPAPRAA